MSNPVLIFEDTAADGVVGCLAMGSDWPLVGRVEELEFVRDAVGAESPSGLVLAGMAGVGKTRLALEALGSARAQGLVAEWAVATKSAASIPFGALAHLLPVRDALSSNRLALLQWSADALVARADGGRLVLGVDDAHLLDDASAALVHQLVLTDRVFPVVTVRTGEPTADPIVSLWKDGLATRFDVQPLARAEVGALLTEVLGGDVEGATLHRLWESSDGNPLFLRELVQHGVDAGVLASSGGIWRWRGALTTGHRLSEMIESRLGRLDLAARKVMEVLALCEPLGADLLTSLVSRSAVETAERRGLVRATRDGRRLDYRNAHPLYTEVTRVRMPTATSRAIHERLADRVEGTGARRRDDLLRIASWRLDAGSSAQPDLLVAGAVRARAVFDHELSARLAAAALDAGGGVAARLAMAESLYWLGRFEESVAALSHLDETVMSDAQLSEAAIKLASPLFWGLGRVDAAEAVLARAESAIEDVASRAEVVAHHASVCLFNGRPADAIVLAAPVVDDPSSGDRASLRAITTIVPAWAIAGECDRATRAAIDAIPLAMRMADEMPHALGQLMVSQALAHWLAGRLEQSESVAGNLYELAVIQQADDARGLWAFALGRCAIARGQARTAVRLLRESADLLRQDDIGRFLPWSLGALAQALALLGDADGAQAALHEAGRTGVEAVSLFKVDLALGAAWLAAARGEISTARQLALTGADDAANAGQRVAEVMALHDLARLGDPQQAAPRLAAAAPHVDGMLASACAEHAAALVADDGHALEAASAAFDDIGAYLLAAEAAASAAGAHQRSGQASQATLATGRAHALAAAHCEGVRTPALTVLNEPSPVSSLTRREREIATLAAHGLSNREIAAKLILSVRTVDNHLARSFAKLGVSTRGQLPSLLFGLADD